MRQAIIELRALRRIGNPNAAEALDTAIQVLTVLDWAERFDKWIETGPIAHSDKINLIVGQHDVEGESLAECFCEVFQRVPQALKDGSNGTD